MQHPHFIPDSTAGSHKDTAVLLVGTAREFGIDQHDILSTPSGFRITDALSDVLYHEGILDNSTTQTSGHRTAKNSKPTEKE